MDLKQFFEMMEQDDANSSNYTYRKLKKQIKDWGLSHPTLEEVFLRLTNAEEEKRKKAKKENLETDVFDNDLTGQNDLGSENEFNKSEIN